LLLNITALPLDVHLMVARPLQFIDSFAKAGADIITVHVEAEEPERCIDEIKSRNLKAGIALNPDTAPERVALFVESVDMVLQMTVFPGFGGQGMEPRALSNLPILRKMIGADKDLQVDGGIYIENAAQVIQLGANVIVSGTGIFGKTDPTAAARELRRISLS